MKIEEVAKKFDIKDIKALKEAVYQDYEDGDLSKITIRDIVEIADASDIK